jgi:hypothetical protein
MSAPKISIPNLDAITKADVKTGEALAKVQQYINANTTVTTGNKQAAPTFVNPTRPPG